MDQIKSLYSESVVQHMLLGKALDNVKDQRDKVSASLGLYEEHSKKNLKKLGKIVDKLFKIAKELKEISENPK